jgi:hypothetical protein
MIIAQLYFGETTVGAKQIRRPLPLSLRSNRTIKRALRVAYRKFDRRKETKKLLRKYLPQ